MLDMMPKSNNEFGNMIINDAFDLIQTIADSALDVLVTQSELLETIPFVGVTFKLAKGALALRDIFFAKKVCNFIKHLNDGSVSREDKIKFISDLEKDPKTRSKIIDITISQIDVHNDIIKTIVLSELLKAHIKGSIDYEMYKNLSYSISFVHPLCFRFIVKTIEERKRFDYQQFFGGSLVGAGLGIFPTGVDWGGDENIELTSYSRILYDHALSKIKEEL